jgi:hypothetical protein
VREEQRLTHVMGDENHGLLEPLLKTPELLLNVTTCDRIEGAEGLI